MTSVVQLHKRQNPSVMSEFAIIQADIARGPRRSFLQRLLAALTPWRS